MGIVSIAVVIMAVTLIVIAAAIVPAFMEIRKSAIASRETLERIEGDLRPILHELRDSLAELKLIVRETADKREELAIFMGALGNAGRSMKTINSMLGSVAGVISNSSVWIAGAKVAGKYVAEKFLRKRGKEHVEQ